MLLTESAKQQQLCSIVKTALHWAFTKFKLGALKTYLGAAIVGLAGKNLCLACSYLLSATGHRQLGVDRNNY